jgi:hypothetical protein
MEKGSFVTSFTLCPMDSFLSTFPKLPNNIKPLLGPILYPVAIVSVEPAAHIQYKCNSREKVQKVAFTFTKLN